ncbi:thiol reductant ABC exporter subunit CydD [soil metagenome]
MKLGAQPRTVFVLGLLAALKALALVGIAQAVATGIVSVIAGATAWSDAVALGLAAGLLRALITWASVYYATRASIGAKESLRRELAERLLTGSDSRVGAASALGTVGLDELDNYYRTALPAVVTAAVLPLLVGARILFADPVSAIIIVVTVPLVPVFMALVGMHTRDRADAASVALQRLSDQLVELARGLPVLVGLGRVEEQSAALRKVSERSRATTMATLRTAFLSSLVLELIATISVAVVAVFVGVRMVSGDLSLTVGLIALVLAPECFAPFRELGAAFHSSQQGLAALRGARELIDSPAPADVRTQGGEARLTGVVMHRDGRDRPVIAGLSLVAHHGDITSIEGPSGSGKSTVLGLLAGIVHPDDGSVTGVDAIRVAWVPQFPHTVAPTVRDEVRLYADDSAAGDQATDAALETLALTHLADADPARLSPGELRRLAVARGLVRVAAGADLLLLDEPTAHLDPANAARVEAAILALRGSITIVLASHEAGITRLADHRVLLGRAGGREVEQDRVLSSTEGAYRNLTTEAPARTSVPELLTFLRPAAWRTVAAILLGTAASLAALSLLAVSGWLIVRASEHPPIMYLLVAIVGVRFFGLGRAGLRYAERLMTHDGVLASVTELRLRLWNGLAARGPASRELATGGSALDYLVGAADRVRDLVPRVILPPAVAVVTSFAAIVAVGLLHPAAVPVLLGGLAVSVLIAPAVALLADRHAARGIAAVRSLVLRHCTATGAAADELRSNSVGDRALDRLGGLDARSGSLARSTSWALGLGSAIVVLACSATAMLMLPVAASADGLPPAIVAVLVLIPLGLIEPLLGLVDAVQQWPALSAALARVRAVAAPASVRGEAVGTIESIALEDMSSAWPGTGTMFGPVSARVERGDWLVVEGPSGSGKSTLLATLLGYLPPASGAWFVNGTDASTLDADSLRRHVAWCPQEAHLFDSTIRGNLLLARARDDRPTDAEMVSALTTVGLAPLLGTLDDGLDTRVGSADDRLSGGERQRLAVARTLLTRSDVVLLDEPTAHLDADGADLLIDELRDALADRIVVLVSHHASERRPGDIPVRLGQQRVELVETSPTR